MKLYAGWSLLGGSRKFVDKLSKYVIDCDDSTRLDSSLFCIVGPLQSIRERISRQWQR